MALIDGAKTQLDNTARVFDKFYEFDATVNANEYDIIFSYFFSVSNNRDVAGNFTAMIFRIAGITGINSLELLNDIKGTTKLETNALIAYYLNNLKSKTSLYGIGAIPTPNQTVQRNVVI